MASQLPPLTADEANYYLDRLDLSDAIDRPADRRLLDDLSLTHLVNVPFENLDIVFAGGVPHDPDHALDKILRGRGGWCFEVNASFARLLEYLGYDVLLIGCAVLLNGPSTMIEHLILEVSNRHTSPPPLLADVGFGDSFVFPLELNRTGLQAGGNGDYELLPSPQGITLARHGDGPPRALLRFKRVALGFEQFLAASSLLQGDPERSWSSKPFVTRLTSADERLSLRHDAATRHHGDAVERKTINTHERWDQVLNDWFSMVRPGPWPADG